MLVVFFKRMNIQVLNESLTESETGERSVAFDGQSLALRFLDRTFESPLGAMYIGKNGERQEGLVLANHLAKDGTYKVRADTTTSLSNSW